MGHLMVAAAKVAEQEGLADDGFRVVINDGAKVRERAPEQVRARVRACYSPTEISPSFSSKRLSSISTASLSDSNSLSDPTYLSGGAVGVPSSRARAWGEGDDVAPGLGRRGFEDAVGGA